MARIKKPLVVEELTDSPLEESIEITENSGIRLLSLYLEKRELLEEDEKELILKLIAQFCLPRYKIEGKHAPIEEDWLKNIKNKFSKKA